MADLDSLHRWLAARRWRRVNEADRRMLDRLVAEGRAEYMTGGRVRASFLPSPPVPVTTPKLRAVVRSVCGARVRRPLWERALEARHGGR